MNLRVDLRHLLRGALATTVLAGGLTAAAAAQRAAPPEPGSGITIYLVTIGPGNASWERFGHNGIWVQDPDRGIDAVYNYGLFSFRQENFILRFIQGRMLYWMQGLPARPHLQSYIAANRSVWLQELNLTPAERVALRDFLLENEQPANRFYRYDYYRDNCSTRVRDAIDGVIGHRLRARTAERLTDRSYRFHTQRLTAADLWLYTGLLIGLGRPVDRPITEWEEMFLPIKVREYARDVTLTRDGREEPLIRAERTLFAGTEPEPRAAPPAWWPWYGLIGLALAGSLILLGWRSAHCRLARLALGAGAGLWLLTAGLVGCVLAGLWLFTNHAFSYGNENLLLFSPLALPLALLLPAAVFGWRWAARPAAWLAWAVAAGSVLAALMHLVPGWSQGNGALLALSLPLNLALVRLARVSPVEPG